MHELLIVIVCDLRSKTFSIHTGISTDQKAQSLNPSMTDRQPFGANMKG
jgi:nitrite reductase/ring-hydroxylating ferredoxin subunit